MSLVNGKKLHQNISEDCILVIRNQKIYDITKFARSHPGGKKILQLYHGKDVTTVMKSGVHSHSSNAYRWLEQYYVGESTNSTIEYDKSINGKITNGILDHISTDKNSKEDDAPDLINWNEPVLWQVGNIGAKYHDWIDEPVDKPLRLFKSNFVEFFSITPWYIIPIVWLPIMALLLYRSYSAFLFNEIYVFFFTVPLSLMPIIFISGIFGWTFTEYALHRWLFHRDPPTTSYSLITLHFLLHGQHHKVPFDSGRLVFPPVPAFVLGSIIYSTLRLVFVTAVSDAIAAGIIFGYICYDLTHYYLHYGSPNKGSYFDRLRAYHVRHHFESPHLGFGISSKFWDYPFNTLIRSINGRD